jgi:hypothetical protein
LQNAARTIRVPRYVGDGVVGELAFMNAGQAAWDRLENSR